MILCAVLPAFPLLTAVLNRYWRGEGNAPRWLWYTFMTLAAGAVSYKVDWAGFIWLPFLLGYAMAPWQAMFSAITGGPPSRRDSLQWQWMQTLAYKLTTSERVKAGSSSEYWKLFGVVYGAIRGSLMLPGVAVLTYFYHSPAPLLGILFLNLGVIYYIGGKMAEHIQSPNAPVPISEFIVGYLLGWYMLVVGLSV